MRLIWYSTASFIGVGYGIATRELVHRMQKDGHEVKVATKHHIGGRLKIEGIESFDGTNLALVNSILDEENYDYIITSQDAWTFSKGGYYFTKKKWVASIFLDTEFIHPHMCTALNNSSIQIAMTKHSQREAERAGFKPLYAPLGVDTKLFSPNEEVRREFRAKKRWADNIFVIGLIGINYGTDRKNIIGLLKAFQKFHQKHQDSILYLHTDVLGSSTDGLPIKWIIGNCGFGIEGDGAVKFVNQKEYQLWNISQKELSATYNGLDVFCFPTCGEGFGMPIVEAQACGCPAIVTDTTSGRELVKGGWLIPVSDDDYEFSTLLTWFARVRPTAIEDKLELAYKAWENGTIKKRREKARKGMLKYDWDYVYDTYWRPILEKLEDNLRPKIIEVRNIPDYENILQKFNGRLFIEGADCGTLGCQAICNLEYVKLPEEPGNSRSILSRSYPVFPDENGRLMVYTECKYHKWLSHRFINEVHDIWKELFSYPIVRKRIKELWEDGYFDKPYVALEDRKIEFNEEYANIMQTIFYTIFEITDEMCEHIKRFGNKVIDVGCGDGERIRDLKDKGFDAIGIEVNDFWVDNKLIFKGDIYNLPYEDNSFDGLVCLDVLEHLEDPLKAIKEIFRICKGILIIEITTLNDRTCLEDITHQTLWDVERWKRELSEYGTILKDLGQAYIMEKKI